nr:enolase C-terminal domain-like protein [Halosimplex halophilum]
MSGHDRREPARPRRVQGDARRRGDGRGRAGPANCGGLRDFRRIATLCDLEGVPIVAHNIQGPVGTVAAAHAAASVPNFVALEYHAFDVPWFEDLVDRTGEDGDVIEDGQIDLPEGPGLGIEIDFDVAEQYLLPGEELV